MPNSRALIIGLILAALVGLAAWLGLRRDWESGQPTSAAAEKASTVAQRIPSEQGSTVSRETAPEGVSQTTGAPVPNVTADSQPRLDLHTIHACHDALMNQKALEKQKSCDDIPAEQTTDLMFCRDQEARAAKEVNDAVAGAAPCPADLVNASAYYDAIKELALRGDLPAQRCFIQGYFASAAGEGEESRMRKEQVDEYPGLARKFIDEAFERGDWSVVRSLARMRLGLQDGMLRTAYPFGSEHPETAYRMNYLLVLGNQQNFEKRVDERQLVDGFKTNKTLSAEQLQEAETWARNMYDQHFNGSQEGASATKLCEHP
jgi:hypothetical protein